MRPLPANLQAPPADRRDAERTHVDCPARLYLTTGTLVGSLWDLSAGGARIVVDNPPRAGVEALLKWQSHEAFGRVIWSRDGMCGVAFDRPLPRSMLDESLLPREEQEAKPAGPAAAVDSIPLGRRRFDRAIARGTTAETASREVRAAPAVRRKALATPAAPELPAEPALPETSAKPVVKEKPVTRAAPEVPAAPPAKAPAAPVAREMPAPPAAPEVPAAPPPPPKKVVGEAPAAPPSSPPKVASSTPVAPEVPAAAPPPPPKKAAPAAPVTRDVPAASPAPSKKATPPAPVARDVPAAPPLPPKKAAPAAPVARKVPAAPPPRDKAPPGPPASAQAREEASPPPDKIAPSGRIYGVAYDWVPEEEEEDTGVPTPSVSSIPMGQRRSRR